MRYRSHDKQRQVYCKNANEEDQAQKSDNEGAVQTDSHEQQEDKPKQNVTLPIGGVRSENAAYDSENGFRTF